MNKLFSAEDAERISEAWKNIAIGDQPSKLARQLADTIRERDRYKELWESVHIYYNTTREEVESIRNKGMGNAG